MKTKIRNSYMLLAIYAILTSCTKDSLETGHIPFGSDFTLAMNEQITIGRFSNQVTVEIENLYDTRCPIDMACIPETRYGVDLTVNDATQSTQISLCNLFCGRDYTLEDTIQFILNERMYSIVLKNVLPDPRPAESEPNAAILNIFQ